MPRRTAGVLALLVALGTSALAASNAPVRLLIDGRAVERTTALAHAGTVYVELGGIVRAFSGLVVFEHKTATVSIGDRVAIFTVGSSRANLDGNLVSTGGKTFETNGDFFVPLHFVATRVAHATVRIASGGNVATITSLAVPFPTPTPAPVRT